MNSVQCPSLVATISLAQSVFQLCGPAGIPPACSIRYGDYEAVARAAMPDPMRYNSADTFAKAYLAYNLLRKFSSFPINIDRRANASADFDLSEVQCGITNHMASALPYRPAVSLDRQPQSVVELARRLIKQALGKFDLEEFQTVCDFSSGSSTRVPRKRGAAVFKLDGRPHVTINCRDLAVHFIWCNELWRKHCQATFGRESDPYTWVELIPGSRFDTVPKDSVKDRPICVEPDLNMFFQKGIGTMIRRRLRMRGINLNDQTLNQYLALLGSIHDDLATIDLSSASDSVSLRVVEMLLPEDWYDFMLRTRSPYVLKDGKWVRLNKISSMGNGFTFELESLIFWALAKATCILNGQSTDHLSVYGDDIIVPSAAAEPLIEILELLGFKTNENKTFVAGPFRESCGKHYFMGADVSPIKIADPIENWADIYHFCNSLQGWGWLPQVEVDRIISDAIKPIPPRSRCYVPPNMGTRTGLRVDSPPKRAVYDRELGSFVYKYHYMKEEVKEHDQSGPVAYLASMLLMEQRKPSSVDDTFHVKRDDLSVINDSLGYGTLSRVEKGSWVRRCASTSSWCDVAA